MTATYASSTTLGIAAGTGSAAVARPTGTASGDLLLCWMYANTTSGSITWTQSAGSTFSKFAQDTASGVGSALWSRVCDGTETSTFTFARGNTTGAALVVCIRIPAGTFNIITPVSAVGFVAGTTTTIALPSVSPVNGDIELLQCAGFTTVLTAPTWTAPGSQTIQAQGTGTGQAIPYVIGDETVVASGATGSRTWTHTTSTNTRGAMVAVNPAPNSAMASTSTMGVTGSQQIQPAVAMDSTSTVGLTAATHYAANFLALSPIWYSRIGELSGTTAADLAGGHNGTYNNTPTLGVAGALADDSDTAVTFTAASSEDVRVAFFSALNTTTFTLVAWVKGTGANQVVIGRQGGNTAPYAMVADTSGKLRCDIKSTSSSNPTGSYIDSASTVVNDGAWHLVAVSRDGGTAVVAFNVDGVQTSTIGSTLAPYTGGSSGLAVASRGNTPFYDGSIDEPGVFNTVLTPTQLTNLYISGRTFTSAIAMDSTSGLALSAVAGFAASVAMDSTSTLATSGRQDVPTAVAMASTSTMGSSGQQSIPTAIAMDSTSALASTGSQQTSSVVAMDSTSALSVAGSISQSATVTFASTSALAVSGRLSALASIALDSISVLAVDGSVVASDVTAAVAMDSTSVLALSAVVPISASVAMDSTSDLALSAMIAPVAAIVMASTSDLLGTGSVLVPGGLNLISTSALFVTAVLEVAAAIAMDSVSTLTLSDRVLVPASPPPPERVYLVHALVRSFTVVAQPRAYDIVPLVRTMEVNP